jgi:hypothetical protein
MWDDVAVFEEYCSWGTTDFIESAVPPSMASALGSIVEFT